MTKKPVKRKIVAFATAVMTMTVLCGMPSFAFAADNGVTKEETVYVVTDAAGTQRDVIVSDHLINKGKIKTIADQSNLSGIENVKGEETFKQDGESLTWDAEGNGIYYQGTSEDEIPVTMDVVYRLNDKVVTGSELQGQSGKVEIKINYTNDAEYKGTTVPFIVMTGMVITDDSFKNVKISKGKVIDDGDKLLVVGMAAPGLAQTLDIGESDLGIGSSVTITGDADKFAVEDMMTVVTNSFFEDLDTDEAIDLDYDDEINKLDQGAQELVKGSDKLNQGLDTVAENMPELQDGVIKLDNGAIKLRGSLKSKMKQISSATNKMHQGMKPILAGLKEMKTGLDKVDKDNPNKTGAIDALGQVAKGLNDGVQTAKDGAAQLSGAAEQLQEASDGAYEMDQTLQGGIEQIEPGLKQLNGSLGELNRVDMDALQRLIENSDIDATTQQQIIGVMKNYKTVANNAAGLAGQELDGMKNAQAGANKLYNGLNNVPPQIQGAADGLTNSAAELQVASAAVTAVQGGLKDMSAALGQYDKKAKKQETVIGGLTVINAGLGQLHSQTAKSVSKSGALTKALNQLVGGTGELKNGTDKLADGIDQLDSGSQQLADGMSKLYEQGIKKIVDMYYDELKGKLDSADSMIDAGKGYKTFTRLPSGMDGNVKFIYKTDMTN